MGTYYILGNPLLPNGAGHTVENKTDNGSYSHGAYILGEETK